MDQIMVRKQFKFPFLYQSSPVCLKGHQGNPVFVVCGNKVAPKSSYPLRCLIKFRPSGLMWTLPKTFSHLNGRENTLFFLSLVLLMPLTSLGGRRFSTTSVSTHCYYCTQLRRGNFYSHGIGMPAPVDDLSCQPFFNPFSVEFIVKLRIRKESCCWGLFVDDFVLGKPRSHSSPSRHHSRSVRASRIA